MKIEISEVEQQNLNKVFDILTGSKEFWENEKKWFDAIDLKRVLKQLGLRNIPQ